jgi:hypothetical protein
LSSTPKQDVHCGVVVVEIEIDDPAGGTNNAGVVYQAIGARESAIEHCRAPRFTGYVGLNKKRRWSDPAGNWFTDIRATPGDDDLRTLLGKQLCGPLADSAGSTSNDRNFAFEHPQFHSPLPCFCRPTNSPLAHSGQDEFVFSKRHKASLAQK